MVTGWFTTQSHIIVRVKLNSHVKSVIMQEQKSCSVCTCCHFKGNSLTEPQSLIPYLPFQALSPSGKIISSSHTHPDKITSKGKWLLSPFLASLFDSRSDQRAHLTKSLLQGSLDLTNERLICSWVHIRLWYGGATSLGPDGVSNKGNKVWTTPLRDILSQNPGKELKPPPP